MPIRDLRQIKASISAASDTRPIVNQRTQGNVMSYSDPSPSSLAYASIMVAMDLDPEAEKRAKLATALADRFSARLIGIAAHPIAVPLYFEAPVSGLASAVELEERRATVELANAEAVFRRIAGTRNRIGWRSAHAFPLDYVLEHARAADLIVTSRPRREEGAFGPMSINGGDLVMGAGRPVLFVPPGVDYISAKRIVIGWKDSREARRAVFDGLPLLKAAQEVTVVSIDADDRGANDVSAYLGYHGAQATVVVRTKTEGAVADELLRRAEQEGADLIVCGAYGHSRAREWAFGGVTRDLLDHAPLCCLMAH
jgi:nucleotide-binding universal stress UspA family protein